MFALELQHCINNAYQAHHSHVHCIVFRATCRLLHMQFYIINNNLCKLKNINGLTTNSNQYLFSLNTLIMTNWITTVYIVHNIHLFPFLMTNTAASTTNTHHIKWYYVCCGTTALIRHTKAFQQVPKAYRMFITVKSIMLIHVQF